ncbi:MAG: DUF4959 domain-containing protein [Tannerella sp.]|jgi:hypothetical protein|nr:DUF4959 domain-containing protein [Tannerella sp.]
MDNTKRFILMIVALIANLSGCKESERFEINYSDTTPPGKPVISQEYKALYGGARIYFTPPEDKDVLTVDASYMSQNGKKFWFSSSYFSDSIDVEGFSDTLPKNISVYAVDRAGNKSEEQIITVTPKEPAVMRIANSIAVKPGFGSFYLDWRNELRQVSNIYVNYSYHYNGITQEYNMIYTSTDTVERKYIRVEDIPETTPISVNVQVEDRYGNICGASEETYIHLIKDEKIPKDKWTIPKTNDSIGGEPQGDWNGYEGRAEKIIDDIVDDGFIMNFGITPAGKGRTGNMKDGNLPCNFIIDLGEEWEISRIVTHQRDAANSTTNVTGRGWYYLHENVGIYSMYIYNDTFSRWDSIATHKILFPPDLPGQQYRVMAQAGDMAYLYPDDPHFSAPTRKFRYEAKYLFSNDYTGMGVIGLSEITLYGRRKNN